MSDFDDLPSLLSHLEAHAAGHAGLSGLHKISTLFEAVFKRKEVDGEHEEAEKALWERWVFDLVFKDGDLENWCEHITQGFDDRAYAYLTGRLRDTKNSVLIARYAHVLWCSPKKDIKHAQAAVDSYLTVTKWHEREDVREPQGESWFQVIVNIRNAYGLAASTKYRVDHAKSEIIRQVKHFNVRSRGNLRVRQELLGVMLKDKKHFGKGELAGIEHVCWRLAKIAMRSSSECQVQDGMDMIDLGQQVDQRLKQESHDWCLMRAQCYEKKMHMRKEGDLAVPGFCLNAIENYRKSGREAKARSLETDYGSLAGSVRLAHVSVPVDMTNTIRAARKLAEKTAKLSPGEVVSFLVNQPELLPRCVDIKRMLSQGVVDPLLMDAASSTIDNRGHLTEHSVTTAECEKRVSLQLYAQHLELHCLAVIDEVILRTVGQQKLSASALREQFQERSWLGKDRMAQSPTRGTYRYRWWDLLEPGLVGYFEKTRQWLLDGMRVPNLMLEIDSLTPKFEGLLRDLLQLAGAPTFQPKKQDHSLTEEMYIGKLLRMDDVIKRLFEEDDLFFLRFLFSEDGGYDLRNKIAHCLMLAEDYSIQYMHLLLLALLKLSKYDFAQADEFILTRHSFTFHRTNCRMVTRIAPKDRATLSVSDAAQRKKYKPCGLCNPDHSEEAHETRIDGRETQPILVTRF